MHSDGSLATEDTIRKPTSLAAIYLVGVGECVFVRDTSGVAFM
jgi:hypothetical protein